MKNIIVLMSTYNGEKYLTEQIDSILKQKGVNVSLIVRDDGSEDNTHKILEEYQRKGLLKWYTGENLKPLGSFMHLLSNCKDADYYAFSDQDDIWLPNKLKLSLDKIEEVERSHPNKAVIIHTDMTIVDKDLNPTTGSFWDNNGIRPDILKDFEHLACYNGVNGCTVLMNEKSRRLILEKSFVQDFMIHDVFSALLVTGNGGIVDYVDKQTMLYRQHENNVVGADADIKHRLLKRLSKTLPILKHNYKNYVFVNKIRSLSAFTYLKNKFIYIITKKHGLRK